jgi:hypothetical protein
MAYQFGDGVLVPFPFTDQPATKQRPGVIVSSLAYHRTRRDLILMPITSQVRGGGEFGEVILEDWQSARLLKPSAVNPYSPPSSALSCAPSADSPPAINSAYESASSRSSGK